MRIRFASLFAVLSAVAAVMLTAGPAHAATPNTWEKAEPTSALEMILVFGGGTLVLIVVCVLIGLLTSRHNYVPPAPGSDVEVASDRSPAHH